jgi:hypothetical protein
MSIDLADPAQWNLVDRRLLTAGTNGRIPDQSFVVSHNQIFVGVKVANEPTWNRGGYLIQYLMALPSSTADLFAAATQVAFYRLTCRNYQVINLVDATPKPYLCLVRLPPYFKACTLELYQRNDP